MPQMIVLLACLLWAVCRTAPQSLRTYFRAQWAAAFLVLFAMTMFGERSDVYTLAWVGTCIIVWVTMFGLVYDAVMFHPIRSVAVLMGFLVAGAALFASVYKNEVGLMNWISLSDGAVCTFCAIVAGMGAAYLKRHDMWIALTLTISWMASAIFDFGFSLHMDAWLPTFDQWVPTAIAAISTLTLSRLAQREAH